MIGLATVLMMACTITWTKTEEWIDTPEGCKYICTEKIEITANGTTAEGTVNFGIGSVKFKVGDKQSECKPKTPNAMNAAKAAIEPCLCKDADGDGQPDPPQSDEDDAYEEGGGEDGVGCGDSDETVCKYEFTDAEWDCKEI
jgi:hypothetical protein